MIEVNCQAVVQVRYFFALLLMAYCVYFKMVVSELEIIRSYFKYHTIGFTTSCNTFVYLVALLC